MQKQFVATFLTHLGAMEFHEQLQALGDTEAVLAPVPRSLSVSCGTGVFFRLPYEHDRMGNEDLEAVFLQKEDGRYEKLFEND